VDSRSFVSDVFGMVLIGTAIGLAVWEIISHRFSADRWLHPRSRLWRRLLIAGLLASVGVLLSLEARQLLPTQTPGGILRFAALLGLLAALLLILALVDIVRTVDVAVKHSLREVQNDLKSAITSTKTTHQSSDEKRAS